jgi:hypothetical protein
MDTKTNTEKVTDNTDVLRREEEFAKDHRKDTDEQLLRYLRDCAAKLGHIPNKHDVEGFMYIKSRFGPWPRVLERAGLKEIRPKTVRRNSVKK